MNSLTVAALPARLYRSSGVCIHQPPDARSLWRRPRLDNVQGRRPVAVECGCSDVAAADEPHGAEPQFDSAASLAFLVAHKAPKFSSEECVPVADRRWVDCVLPRLESDTPTTRKKVAIRQERFASSEWRPAAKRSGLVAAERHWRSDRCCESWVEPIRPESAAETDRRPEPSLGWEKSSPANKPTKTCQLWLARFPGIREFDLTCPESRAKWN